MEPLRASQDADDRDFELWLEIELRKRAHRLLAYQPRGATLQPTSLVNEAWIAISTHDAYRRRDRGQFLRMMPRILRSVVVDYARARSTSKRGGDRQRLPIAEAECPADFDPTSVLDLHHAVEHLSETHPRVAQVIEAFYFGGQSKTEVARHLGANERAVDRDLRFGRAWLSRFLGSRGYEAE